MMVHVHLERQAAPIVITDVRNTYQKGDFYCVMLHDRVTVHKFPVDHIFRVTEYSEPNVQTGGS